jgi:hypothetical protein
MRAWVLSLLLLAGCSGIPSFYDDNESLAAVEVRFAISKLDCSDPYIQVQNIKDNVDFLALYSESKRSTDLEEMILLMKDTVDTLYEKENISPVYCELKKKILVEQSADIANAVMWRL